MPPSILGKAINYKETNSLAPEDHDIELNQYSLKLNDKERILALGLPKYDYIANNIIYFPIYLIVDEKFVARIGVYEILENVLVDIKDDNDDVDIEKLDMISQPLYFIKYKDELLKKLDLNTNNRESEREKDDDDNIPVIDNNIPVINNDDDIPVINNDDDNIPVINNDDDNIPVINNDDDNIPVIEKKEKRNLKTRALRHNSPLVKTKKKRLVKLENDKSGLINKLHKIKTRRVKIENKRTTRKF